MVKYYIELERKYIAIQCYKACVYLIKWQYYQNDNKSTLTNIIVTINIIINALKTDQISWF